MSKRNNHSHVLGSVLLSMLTLCSLSGAVSVFAGAADQSDASLYTSVAKDPLLTPALMAPMAARTLLLSITQAGDRLVAVGEHGNIVYSDDHGKHWEQASVPVSTNLTAVTFVGSDLGWAVGHHGVILGTTDGGLTWELLFDGMQAGKQVIEAAQARYEAAEAALENAAEDAAEDEKEAALERLDLADLALGDALASIEFGPAQPLMDIWFGSETEGVAVGSYGQIFRTTDGGHTWTLWKHKIDNPNNYHFYGIKETDSGVLYLVGEQGGIFRSADNGENWTALNSPYHGSFYGALTTTHADAEVLLVYGFNGHLYRSTDAGETWQQIESNTRRSINDGLVMNDGSLVLVGNNGVVLHSTDGGKSFSTKVDAFERPFVSIIEVDGDKLAMVGITGARVITVSEATLL